MPRNRALLPAALLALTAIAQSGCSLLNPHRGPEADFVADVRTGRAPLEVTFTDQSEPGTSPITGWTWSFGDGSTSSELNPLHVYPVAGSYTVGLRVRTKDGTDLEEKAAFIVVSPGVRASAEFQATPRSGEKPLTVQFTDQSTPGTGTITSWSWAFGDGQTSTAKDPVHVYQNNGAYDVSLAIRSPAGTDTTTKSRYIVVTTAPVAAFTGSPRSGFTPLSVQFTDQSSAGSSPITSWAWTFGDGGTSVAQSPSHVYAGAGTYDVSLTVTTADGTDSEAKSAYVVATNPTLPVAGFSGAPRSGNIPLTVQFTDQSTAGSFPITSRSWSFGDGATSTAQNPSHAYSAAGAYTVTLVVTTTAGSDGETKTGYIVASKPPVAAFDGAPRSGDRPLTVQFSDLSTAGSSPISTWSWAFGDGGTSSVQNPSHPYTAAGTYTVTLTVTAADGSDTITKSGFITVTEPPAPPAADFSGSPTSGAAPLTVQFTDHSSPGSAPITSWLWSFGDLTTSAAQNPSHAYALPGTYDVTLEVTTADGSDTMTKAGYITVCAGPSADFAGSPTSGLAPLTVQFTDLSVSGTEAITGWSWTFGDGATSTEASPTHAYTAPGVYDVSLNVSTACGSNAATKPGYVTVQDPCTNVTYSIADASFEIRADADNDGCAERARVHFDADVQEGCSKSVFGKVLMRPKGSADWTFQSQTACFTISGVTPADASFIQVQGLPPDTYEIRIELYECGGTQPVASRDYLDDPDLDNRCME